MAAAAPWEKRLDLDLSFSCTSSRILPLHQANAGPAYRVVEGEAEEGPRRPVVGGATFVLALGVLLSLALGQGPHGCRPRRGVASHGRRGTSLGTAGGIDRSLPGQASRVEQGRRVGGEGGAGVPKWWVVTRGRGSGTAGIICP